MDRDKRNYTWTDLLSTTKLTHIFKTNSPDKQTTLEIKSRHIIFNILK